MAPVYFDPVLTYAVSGLDSATVAQVKHSCASFYTADELTQAKTMLWDAAEESVIGGIVNRRESRQRSETDKIVEDIVTALNKLMSAKSLPNFAVGPDKLHRIPRAKPQETLDISVCERLNSLEERLQEMQMLSIRVSAIESRQKPLYNQVAAMTPSQFSFPRHPPPPSSALGRAGLQQQTQQSSNGSPSSINVDAAAAGATGAPGSNTNDGQFIEPRRKRRRQHQKHVIGSKTDSTLKVAPLPNLSVFVARFDRATTENLVKQYVNDNGVEVSEVERLSRDSAPQASFRIEVKLPDFSRVRKAEFWPEGILVDKFYGKPRSKAHLQLHPSPSPSQRTSRSSSPSSPKPPNASPNNG